MGRKPLDTRERANNLIKTFSEDLNKRLKEDPNLAKNYTLNSMRKDFADALHRESAYSASNMSDILKRNGLAWSKSRKQIVTTTELEAFIPEDYLIHERIYQTFISVESTSKKSQLKKWLENDASVCDDILAVISTPKGLLIFSDKEYIRKNLKIHLGQK